MLLYSNSLLAFSSSSCPEVPDVGPEKTTRILVALVLALLAASCDRDPDTSLSLGGGNAFPSPPPAKMPLVLSFWSITMMSERWRTNVACRRRIRSANNAITPISFLLCRAKDRGGIATTENKQTRRRRGV